MYDSEVARLEKENRRLRQQESVMDAKAGEFVRLVLEYRDADPLGSTKEEAWNLIADFAIENAALIIGALTLTARTEEKTDAKTECGAP